jgi:general secretion pathway protein D
MTKLLLVLILSSAIFIFKLNANDDININFKDLKIPEFIKITSKIINKNILITQEIEGNVNFVSTKPINKNDLLKILKYVLEDKGYTLISDNDILRVVKQNKEINLPETSIGIPSNKEIIKKETKIFYLKNIEAINVIKILDSIISKNIYDNPNIKPIISLDDELNAVIVKATIEDMNDIKILIDELEKKKLKFMFRQKL